MLFRPTRFALNSRPRLNGLINHPRNFSSSSTLKDIRYQYVRFGGSQKRPFYENKNTLKVVAGILGVGGIYWYTQ